MVLKFRDLHAGYGGHAVLRGVDLDVREGAIAALVAPNGSGKTTVLKSVLGLEVWRRGVVEVLGSPCERSRPEAVARLGVGYVPEERRLFPFSVRENLQLAASVHPKERRLTVDEVCDRVPLVASLLNLRADTCSGGEQQAVAIARAMMGSPRLMIVDEPTEGLAPIVAEQIGQLLGDIAATRTAVLVAEENAQFIAPNVTDWYAVESGRLGLRAGPDTSSRGNAQGTRG